MDKQHHLRRVALGAALAVLMALAVGCGDDEDSQTACEAAQELEGSLRALGDADAGDIGDAAETVADDFQNFVDRASDASRDEIQELSDSVGELTDAVADDGGEEQVEQAVDDVDQAWDGLVDMVETAANDCELDADLG